MIIGLTGKYAAGKGTVAEFLLAQDFKYHSLSDILREELDVRGVEESREALLALGNELRREGGPGVLAERLLERLNDGAHHIVDSIRNPVEVQALRKLTGFRLISVQADVRTRYDRLISRARVGDPITWEEFSEIEARETESPDPHTQQLAATMTLADQTLSNDTTREELGMRLESLLLDLYSPEER